MMFNGKRIAALSLATVLVLGIVIGLVYDHHRTPNSKATGSSETAPIASSTPTPLGSEPSILFYGGSITSGSLAATSAETYRELVVSAASIGGPAKPTVVAKKGVQTFSFLEEHPAPPVDADLTVVELGTNDVGKTKPPVFRETYRTLLDSIRKTNPDGLLVCVGTWTNSKSAQPYDAAIYDECTSHDGRPVLLTRVYSQVKNRGPAGAIIAGQVADNFLPNTAGHKAIAQMVISVLPLEKSVED